MKALARDNGGHDSGTSSGHDGISSVRRRKSWAGFAAVLVMGGALAYGYTRYTAYQKEQERIRKEQEAEQERLRIAREKAEAERKQAERERLQAERERQAAERARQEAERRARQTPQRRYLGKSAIQNIIKSYGFEYSFFGVMAINSKNL